MKLRVMCWVLVLSGCATGSSSRAVTAAAPTPDSARSQARSEESLTEPVRLESSAGTFLVHPNNAQDLRQMLAGEPARRQYISLDVP